MLNKKLIVIGIVVISLVAFLSILSYSLIKGGLVSEEEYNALVKEKENIQEKLKFSETRGQDLAKQIVSVSSENTQLKSQIDRLEKDVLNLNLQTEDKCDELEQDKEDLEQEIEDLEGEIENVNEEIDQKQEDGENTDDLEEELQDKEDELDALKEDLDEVEQDLEDEDC